MKSGAIKKEICFIYFLFLKIKKINENTIASSDFAKIVNGIQFAKPAYKSLNEEPIIPEIMPISGPK